VRCAISSLVLVAGVVLACAPVASADPTAAPPEVPLDPSRVTFVDNPWLVDPQPMNIESWSRNGDGLVVNFTSGVPDCYAVHADVTETPDTVTVELRGGSPPEAVGRICILLAVMGSLDVPLQSPLGDRQVLDKLR